MPGLPYFVLWINGLIHCYPPQLIFGIIYLPQKNNGWRTELVVMHVKQWSLAIVQWSSCEDSLPLASEHFFRLQVYIPVCLLQQREDVHVLSGPPESPPPSPLPPLLSPPAIMCGYVTSGRRACWLQTAARSLWTLDATVRKSSQEMTLFRKNTC